MEKNKIRDHILKAMWLIKEKYRTNGKGVEGLENWEITFYNQNLVFIREYYDKCNIEWKQANYLISADKIPTTKEH